MPDCSAARWHKNPARSASAFRLKNSQFQTYLPGQAETSIQPVPHEKIYAPVLSDDELQRLVRLADEVEAFFGSPQDVEWAIADGTIYLLQSRPITTIKQMNH
jgi:phosphoenolpyruvate synthase/pyruvate phosphate dikinase